MCVRIFLSNARVAGKQLLLNLKTSYVPQVSFAISVFAPKPGGFGVAGPGLPGAVWMPHQRGGLGS